MAKKKARKAAMALEAEQRELDAEISRERASVLAKERVSFAAREAAAENAAFQRLALAKEQAEDHLAAAEEKLARLQLQNEEAEKRKLERAQAEHEAARRQAELDVARRKAESEAQFARAASEAARWQAEQRDAGRLIREREAAELREATAAARIARDPVDELEKSLEAIEQEALSGARVVT